MIMFERVAQCEVPWDAWAAWSGVGFYVVPLNVHCHEMLGLRGPVLDSMSCRSMCSAMRCLGCVVRCWILCRAAQCALPWDAWAAWSGVGFYVVPLNVQCHEVLGLRGPVLDSMSCMMHTYLRCGVCLVAGRRGGWVCGLVRNGLFWVWGWFWLASIRGTWMKNAEECGKL